jgi:alpha-ribazole phosphatase/probable phosphoglycerate mutase
VDLLRHGEPVGGAGRYRGQLDDPLSELGWRQMWRAVDGHSSWHHILTSPLKRCRDFARALSERHGVALSEDERLQEIGFGAWEGKTREELRRTDHSLFTRFYENPLAHRPPGAEPLLGFYQRVSAAWEACLAQHSNRRVLLIAHAGVVRAILCRVLEIPLKNMHQIEVRHAALSRIEHKDGRTSLVFHGGAPQDAVQRRGAAHG